MGTMRNIAKALILLVHGANAYPHRAGTCDGGPAIKDSSFQLHSSIQTPISLETGGFVIKIVGELEASDSSPVISPNSDVSVDVGKDYQVVVQSNSGKHIRGFLFRMEAKSSSPDGNAEDFFAVSSDDDESQVLSVDPSGVGSGSYGSTTCNTGVAAMCHTLTFPELREEVTNFMNAHTAGFYTMDVTVVVKANEWYYDSFTFHVTDSSEEPSMTPSIVASSAPSMKPSTLPSSIPSALPSFAPSAMPSISTSPSDKFHPSAMPSTSASPSRMPSKFPSSLPSLYPSTFPSPFPSANPSSSPSVSTAPSMKPSPGTSPNIFNEVPITGTDANCTNYLPGSCSIIGGISGCTITVKGCNEDKFTVAGGVSGDSSVLIVDKFSGNFTTFQIDFVSNGAQVKIDETSNVEIVKFVSLYAGGKIIAPSARVEGQNISSQSCLIAANPVVGSVTDGARITATVSECDEKSASTTSLVPSYAVLCISALVSVVNSFLL